MYNIRNNKFDPATIMSKSITDLEKVLIIPQNFIILNHSVRPVETSGLSFSSTLKLLKVRLIKSTSKNQVEDLNQKEASVHPEYERKFDEEMNCIVKLMPDKSMWVSLNSETTFEKELDMYTLMVPHYLAALKSFLEKTNVTQEDQLFPEFNGGRLNLENTRDYVDENAVIILEDLKQRGYKNCRLSMLDDHHFKQVLKKLALFHAIGIIIRDDNNKIGFENLLKTTKTFFFGAKDTNIDKINEDRRQNIMNIVKKFNYDQAVNDKLTNVLKQIDHKTLESQPSCYYTLIHNDLWINNIMFYYENHQNMTMATKIQDLKFIDFQNTNFGSVAKDLIFLLYTSVDKTLWNDFDKYVEYYHANLVNNLTTYHSKLGNYRYEDIIASEYGLNKFKNELKTYACHKLKHIFIVLRIISSNNQEDFETSLHHVLDHFIQNKFI